MPMPEVARRVRPAPERLIPVALLWACLALPGSAGAGSPPTLPPIPTRGTDKPATLAVFLDQLDAQWAGLLRAQRGCEAESPQSDTCDPVAWSMAAHELLATPAYLEVLRDRRGHAGSPELETRVRHAWAASLRGTLELEPYLRQVSDELQDSVASFRPDVGGILVTRTQAREILRRDEDRARRRAAYESGARLSARVSQDLLELIRRRNLVARRFGYTDFAALQLDGQELTPAGVEALEDQIEAYTRPAYRALLARIRSRLSVFQLHPWDLVYGQALLEDAAADSGLRGDLAGARIQSFAAGMDYPSGGFPVRMYFQDHSAYGARALAVAPPSDVRLLLHPGNGINSYISVFHELGKGLYEASIADPRPSVRMVPEVWRSTQGYFFGSIPMEIGFLTGGVGLPDSAAASLRRRWLASRVLGIRSLLVLSRFERVMYRSPGVNADSLWRALSERYLELEAPEPSLWASETPLLVQPFSYTQQLVAECASAQFLANLHRSLPWADGLGLRKFLEEVFYRPGPLEPWPTLLERATGAPLGARELARELSGP